jgi:hypothetical protein
MSFAAMDPPLYIVQNRGSAARDFCMLERNLLSHLKLAILLSLLSSSILLRARLVPEPGNLPDTGDMANIPLAAVLFAAALATMGAGAWEYNAGYRDFMKMTAFLQAIKSVFSIACFSYPADMLQSTSRCYHSCCNGSICDMHRAACGWIIDVQTSPHEGSRHVTYEKAYPVIWLP